MNDNPRVLSLLILADPRPGHFRQSEGVVLALQRRFHVTVTRLHCHPPSLLGARFGRRLLRAAERISPALFDRLCSLDRAAVGTPDLIVSAGADTLAANASLARRLGTANIFIGSLREYPESAFSAVLTIYPSQALRPRHIRTLKPTPFDPDNLPPPRLIVEEAALRGAEAALFVGGPSGTHRWEASDWEALERLVAETGERHGIRWRITTSRRTPADASARLRNLARASDAVLDFIDFAEAGPGSADALFSADILVVTEDSATMAMEAVAARRPVVALCPAGREPSRDDEALDGLVGEGQLARLELDREGAATFAEVVPRLTPFQANPLDRLADLIAQAIFPQGTQG